jgi:hypothetical protein
MSKSTILQPGTKHPGNPQPIGSKTIERIVKTAARKAGLGDITPHPTAA